MVKPTAVLDFRTLHEAVSKYHTLTNEMDAPQQREPEINKLFRLAKKHAASALYLDAGSAPRLQLQGIIQNIEMPPLKQEDLVGLVSPLLHVDQRERLDREEDVAFTYALEAGNAYRVEVSNHGGRFHLMAHRLDAG
jgi:Tfp pilus assembly pilus retraction ATPase PilT